ncbi:MAG: tRNA (adenosine(37)-N6)-threonylcarbamoyltransferase complex dimerization subunit type 1 TsaB [bacterium]|nr:tRNA (adenosine(37)-N6)-threonylcarbamoyltransferase complex dimerization subunit type 1 TsaB [bacterium]
MISIFIGNLSSCPSLLLSYNHKKEYFIKSSIKYSHQENIILLIDSLLKLKKATPEDIEELIIYEGPGLFTSLRIGYAVAKAFYLKKPNYKLYTIKSLDALAITKGPDKGHYIPCLPAQKGEVFYALYESKKRISEIGIEKIENLKANYPDYEIGYFPEFPDADALYEAFIELKDQLKPVKPVEAEPFYVRLPDAYSKIRRNNQ